MLRNIFLKQNLYNTEVNINFQIYIQKILTYITIKINWTNKKDNLEKSLILRKVIASNNYIKKDEKIKCFHSNHDDILFYS